MPYELLDEPKKGYVLLEEEKVNPVEGNSFLQNAHIGAGKAFSDIGLGAQQIFHQIGASAGFQSAKDALARAQQEAAERRKRDTPLMETGGGITGNIAGNLAVAVPTMLIPGANTYTGTALTSAALAAFQPTTQEESRLKNMAIGTAAGVGTKYGLDKAAKGLSSYAASRAAQGAQAEAQNAIKDATLTAGREAGYVVPPSQANPTLTNKLAEGVAGKISTAQAASNKNQTVTNALTKKALGLADDAPLNLETLETLRDGAGQAYKAIKQQVGKFRADQQFAQDVAALGNDFAAAAKEFPELTKNAAIDTLKSALAKQEITPTGAMEIIKKLRFDAAKNFKAIGDPEKEALAHAQKQAATAVENLIERNLAASGKRGLVDAFKDARTLIAKSYDVEAALNQTTGNVSAKVLANASSKGRPLTDELKTVADFARAFPKATQEVDKVGTIAGTSPLDWALATGSGNPALLAARPAVRSLALSRPYQAMMTNPNYGPSVPLSMLVKAANDPTAQLLAPYLGVNAALKANQ